MKKLYTCALVLACALTANAATLFANGDDPKAAVGSAVADFKLPDADGKEHALSSLKGKNGTVLIFVSTNCPVSNAYNERMEKLAAEMKARGVAVVGINANVGETAADIKRHSAEHNLSFPILKDSGNRIADRLGAAVTPEAFYLDAQSKLVYKGRIDNSRNGDNITASELRDAVEATIAGKPVEKTEVRAFGCSIKRAS
ncbi:MAG TPA: thioredoxin family protein [Pyrinomonadaceae bacterium]|jgi:peroxiredoxin|nr:thioredoxin family protein [Pyrinomonadaceae bacterium]